MTFLPLETQYHGQRNRPRNEAVVTVGRGRSLERLLHPGFSAQLIEHSKGFEWGYAGSGPSQLALAILLDFTRDRELSLQRYEEFKYAYVAEWTEPRWTISGAEIVAWLQSVGAAISNDQIPTSDQRS